MENFHPEKSKFVFYNFKSNIPKRKVFLLIHLGNASARRKLNAFVFSASRCLHL